MHRVELCPAVANPPQPPLLPPPLPLPPAPPLSSFISAGNCYPTVPGLSTQDGGSAAGGSWPTELAINPVPPRDPWDYDTQSSFYFGNLFDEVIDPNRPDQDPNGKYTCTTFASSVEHYFEFTPLVSGLSNVMVWVQNLVENSGALQNTEFFVPVEVSVGPPDPSQALTAEQRFAVHCGGVPHVTSASAQSYTANCVLGGSNTVIRIRKDLALAATATSATPPTITNALCIGEVRICKIEDAPPAPPATPPSPSPPRPPMPPLAQSEAVLEVSITVAGDAASVDTAAVTTQVAASAGVAEEAVTVTVVDGSAIVTARIDYGTNWGDAQDEEEHVMQEEAAGKLNEYFFGSGSNVQVVASSHKVEHEEVYQPFHPPAPTPPPAPPLDGMECLPTTRSDAYLTGAAGAADWSGDDFDVYYSPVRPASAPSLLPSELFDGSTSDVNFACTYHLTPGTNEYPRFAVKYKDTANHGPKVVYVGELAAAYLGYLVPFRVGVAPSKDGAIAEVCGEMDGTTAQESYHTATCTVTDANPWIVIEDTELATGPSSEGGNQKSLCISELYICDSKGPALPPPPSPSLPPSPLPPEIPAPASPPGWTVETRTWPTSDACNGGTYLVAVQTVDGVESVHALMSRFSFPAPDCVTTGETFLNRAPLIVQGSPLTAGPGVNVGLSESANDGWLLIDGCTAYSLQGQALGNAEIPAPGPYTESGPTFYLFGPEVGSYPVHYCLPFPPSPPVSPPGPSPGAPPAPPLNLQDGSDWDNGHWDASCVPAWADRSTNWLTGSDADWHGVGMDVYVYPFSAAGEADSIKANKLFDGGEAATLNPPQATFSCTYDNTATVTYPRFSFHQTTGYGMRRIYLSEIAAVPNTYLSPFEIGVAPSKNGAIAQHCRGGEHISLDGLVGHQTFSAVCETSATNPWIVVQDTVERTGANGGGAICIEEVAICDAGPPPPTPIQVSVHTKSCNGAQYLVASDFLDSDGNTVTTPMPLYVRRGSNDPHGEVCYPYLTTDYHAVRQSHLHTPVAAAGVLASTDTYTDNSNGDVIRMRVVMDTSSPFIYASATPCGVTYMPNDDVDSPQGVTSSSHYLVSPSGDYVFSSDLQCPEAASPSLPPSPQWPVRFFDSTLLTCLC